MCRNKNKITKNSDIQRHFQYSPNFFPLIVFVCFVRYDLYSAFSKPCANIFI